MKKKKIYEMELLEDGHYGVFAISLVDRPAMESEWIALSSQLELRAIDEDRRMIYGAALIPDKEIYRFNEKTQEEYYIKFSADTIEKSAHRFFLFDQHHNSTIQHTPGRVEGVHFVESWIKEGEQDKSVQLGLDLPNGTWFVGAKIIDDKLWSRVKSGEFKGWSIEGFYGEREVDLSQLDLLALIDEIEAELDGLK
jgi:hypothetical protein